MAGILLTINIIVSILLIVIILMQSSQSSGLSGLLGGSADSLLGSSRGTVLSKITTYLAISFMTITLLLAVMSGRGLFNFGGVNIPKAQGPTYLDKTVAKEQRLMKNKQQRSAQQQQTPVSAPQSVKAKKNKPEPVPLPENELAIPKLNLNVKPKSK